MDYEIKPEEILSYSHQLIIPEIGLQGQIKLKRSSVLIIGCGGLGSPIALYLASAGIGRIVNIRSRLDRFDRCKGIALADGVAFFDH